MKDLEIGDIYLVQSTYSPNIFYFSDEYNSIYWTVNLEETDEFLKFSDWLDEMYDTTITDQIRERFDEQFQTEL